MTDDKLYTSLSANTIMAILTNHVQRTRLIRSSTDQHYSLDSEDDFRSGCRNVSHQQQFFSELHSPGRSHYTNYWYSWVQTIYCMTSIVFKLTKRLASPVCISYVFKEKKWQVEKRPRRYIHKKTVRKNFDLPAISFTRFKSSSSCWEFPIESE